MIKNRTKIISIVMLSTLFYALPIIPGANNAPIINNVVNSSVAYAMENKVFTNGIFEYTPTAQEKAMFDFKYAFVDKEGSVRKFQNAKYAEMIYSQIYGHPSGIFNYTPTAQEKAMFGFKYAFVDKDGELRKFTTLNSADLIYVGIYGQGSGVFNYTPTAQEKAMFDFKYAFTDKQGGLRKFAQLDHAKLIFNSIYGENAYMRIYNN